MIVSPKILVADDDQALTRTLSWILKENGYEVVTVSNGEHLLDRLAHDQYDLLLLDIMMPGADGLQLLERVKTDPRVQNVPVLMISSMPPEEATVRALGLGAADFISKPFRVRELLARVKAHLRVGRELNQARAEARTRTEMVDILQEVTASLKPADRPQALSGDPPGPRHPADRPDHRRGHRSAVRGRARRVGAGGVEGPDPLGDRDSLRDAG
jgi:two-component system cell cycle response regulator